MKCGLLGAKLGHSYSPQIHSYLGSYSYELYEKQPEELEDFLKNGDFTGLNVTIPYKKAVIPYCDELTPIAKKLGAVNTIVRDAQGRLIGHNTDYYGFKSMVERSGLELSGKRALVLGSGGASVTAVAVLKELGAKVLTISRTGICNYKNVYNHKEAAVVVNATPVGMYPNNGQVPIDVSKFPNLEGVFDLIYNPSRTQLMMNVNRRKTRTFNGLWMLVAQAKESAEMFTGSAIADEKIVDIYRRLRMQMENLILIGMPGSGKSTIGKLLAQTLNRPFIDADAVIVEQAKMSIPEIFHKEGEEGFRKRETEVLRQLGKGSGAVIATGGGCVTREENYPLLHQNGKIIWLQRSLYLLPTEGRPLSQVNKLDEMYEKRRDLYASFADMVISNNHTPDVTITRIIAMEEEK